MNFCSRRTALLLACLAPVMAVAQQRPVRIVVVGDSLTAGYGLRPGEDFVSRLAARMGAKGLSVTFVNAGVSGDTTQGGLERIDWSVPDGTDGVILELGANDALRGFPPDKSAANLAAMIERLQKRNIRVLLAGMLAPPNMGAAYQADFNSLYPRLAKRYGLHFYPFFLDGVAGQPLLNQQDGMHPNATGVEVIVDRIAPVIEGFIKELQNQ